MKYPIFSNYLLAQKSSAIDHLILFRGHVSEDGVRALRRVGWSAIQAAVKVEILQEAIDFLEGSVGKIPVILPEADVHPSVERFLLDKVVTNARYPRQSTDGGSELVHQVEGAVWAEIYSTLVSGRPGGSIAIKS